MELSFRLSTFEGPLDLLLHLITKHKLDILEIELGELVRQYLAVLQEQTQLQLEVQSEFLEMAARLVQMKSLSLLPKHEEEAETLKSSLIGELMEYQLCKWAAGELKGRYDPYRVFVRQPMQIDADLTYTNTHEATILYAALSSITGRQVRRRTPSPAAFSKLVSHRVVSVNSRIIYLMRRLYRQNTQGFSDLFSEQQDRSELVATFLALLELVKSGRLTLSDNGEIVTFHRHPIKEEATV